jgi:hypothetical protein
VLGIRVCKSGSTIKCLCFALCNRSLLSLSAKYEHTHTHTDSRFVVGNKIRKLICITFVHIHNFVKIENQHIHNWQKKIINKITCNRMDGIVDVRFF